MVLLASAGWIALGGCATPPGARGPESAPSWTCDEEADRALSQGDLEAGIRLHESFLRSHPDNALALYHLGYAYGQAGDHEREIACYERAEELGFSDGGLFFNLGMAYGETGRVRKAVNAFGRAVQADARNADYRMGLGLALQEAGDLEGALHAFGKAVGLDPSLADARWYAARLLTRMGHYEEAEVRLRELLEIDPQYPLARDLLQRLEAGERP